MFDAGWFIEVAVARFHTLLRAANGSVLVCGRNDDGQLGLGSAQSNADTPIASKPIEVFRDEPTSRSFLALHPRPPDLSIDPEEPASAADQLSAYLAVADLM